ncbi:MAG: inositol 2-dehydrogenase [Anaerolineae bacterium]
MADKIGIGLIGAGRIGRVHGETLARRVPGAKLVTICDVNAVAAQTLADDLGSAVSPSVEAVLSHPEVDAVVICSSTDTHAPFIEMAANAGKDIFCEKPIAADLAIIDAALKAVDEAGVKLMIGFNRRFDANYARVKQAIVDGEIGVPHLMHIISRDPAPPRVEYIKVSGGLYMDMTIHDFDMARFLLGEVTEVYAVGGVMVDASIGDAGDIDTTIITLKFASGALGTIDNSRKAVYGYDQRVEVFGSAGSASSENNYPNAVTISTGDNVRRNLPLNFFMERYLTAYQTELAAFVKALRDGTPMPVTGADGRAPVVIAKAALKSLKENRPVKLSEI